MSYNNPPYHQQQHHQHPPPPPVPPRSNETGAIDPTIHEETSSYPYHGISQENKYNNNNNNNNNNKNKNNNPSSPFYYPYEYQQEQKYDQEKQQQQQQKQQQQQQQQHQPSSSSSFSRNQRGERSETFQNNENKLVPLSEWIHSHEMHHGGGRWEKPNNRVVCVSLLNQSVWIKYASMIASNGRVKLEREGRMEHGVSKFIKKTVTGEGTKLVKAHADGQAYIYIAERGRDLHTVDLRNEADAIVVDGDHVIGFDRSVHWDIIPMKSFGLTGMFNMRLRGPGTVVVGSRGSPLVLHVRDFDPVYTDPVHTIAWSANLSPSVKTDISMKSLFGRGSGDEFQLKFKGNHGFVIVQPKSIFER